MFPNFARRLQQRSSSPATRLASTRTTRLALLLSAPSTVICSRRACCLRLLLANAPSRCSAAIRAARLSPRLQAALLLPACACPSAGLQVCLLRPCCARKAAPRHACRRTPLLRVSCADAAAVAAPSHACLDCVYLPVVPDKPRLCTLIAGPLTLS